MSAGHYIASDYAGLHGGGVDFYYGYEHTLDGEWCFVVHENGTETMKIPASKLGSNTFEVTENLMAGIAQWLERPPAASSPQVKK